MTASWQGRLLGWLDSREVRTEMKRDASGLLSARTARTFVRSRLCSTAKYENSGGDFNLATMSIVSDC